MHDCPPVVLVLFDGCVIVHLLFSHVFGSVTGFVYGAVWIAEKGTAFCIRVSSSFFFLVVIVDFSV